MALYEVDPWGEQRRDMRSAVQSLWNRGCGFTELEIEYPHAPDTGGDSDEDDIDVIEQIAAAQEREKHAPA